MSAVAKLEESAGSRTDTPKRRGRPPKPPMPYDGPTFGLEKSQVTELALDEIDIEDTTFQCRVALRPELLVDSIRHHGIQMPLVIRKHPKKKGRFQVVCGFRRATAAKLAGLAKVPVVVRDLTDEQAHILSYAENEYRKTLTDMDRANGIAKLRQQGKSQEQVARLYRLSDRQVRRLQELLDYPDVVKRAIDDEQSGVTTTHAMLIMQASRKHGSKFDVGSWVAKVRRNKLAVEDIKRMIRKELGGGRRPRFSFRRRGDRIALNLAAFRVAPEATRAKVIEQLESVVTDMKRHHRASTGH